MPNLLDCNRIYSEYSSKVAAYLSLHVSSEVDREDLHSMIFTKIVQHQESYRGNPNAVSSFVYTITRNTVIDYYRTSPPLMGQIPETLEAVSNVEDDFLSTESLNRLAHALERVSEHERKLIVFHYYDGLSLRDISKKMNMSYGRIKLLHLRALLHIKELF